MHTPNPQLRARERERGEKGEWEPASAEQRRGVGRTGKEESSRGKGASRGREN